MIKWKAFIFILVILNLELEELQWMPLWNKKQKINREEGIALVGRNDREFPSLYFREILEYLDMDEDEFGKLLMKQDHLIYGKKRKSVET